MSKHLFSFCSAALLLCLFAEPFTAQAKPSSTANFTLFYTADMHGNVFADEETLGMGAIAALHKTTPNSLLVDAGDFLHGVPAATHSQGKDIITLMQQAGYFAAAMGNHEFSYDFNTVEERIAQAKTGSQPLHLLSANTRRTDGSLLVNDFVATELNGIQVCFFGLTTRETVITATPSSTAKTIFTDELQAAMPLVPTMRRKGCDVIVGLTHIGNESFRKTSSIELARKVPGIDILIDGHNHREMEQKTELGTLVVSPVGNGKSIGELRVTVDRSTKRIVALTNALKSKKDMAGLEPDPTVTASLQTLHATMQDKLNEVVAESQQNLNSEEKIIRTQETNMGNFCADALRLAFEADAAIINGGSFRAGIKKGSITQGDILATLPFTDYAATTKVSGAELLTILEHGFSRLPAADGAFPQISGFSVIVDASAPKGKRIANVIFSNGEPLQPNAIYVLSTNGYLADGGDGYPYLARRPRKRIVPSLKQIILDHLRKTQAAQYNAEKPQRIFYVKH